MPEVAAGEIGETATLETDEEWGDEGELNLLTAPSGESNGDTKEWDKRKDSASGGTYKAAPQDAKDEKVSSLSERHLNALNIINHGENVPNRGDFVSRSFGESGEHIFKSNSILPNNGKLGALTRPRTQAVARQPHLATEEGCRDFTACLVIYSY